jgi:membrane protease YdiL (CAAX protease family)
MSSSIPPPPTRSPEPPPEPPRAPEESESSSTDEAPWPIWTVPAAFGAGLVVGILATAAVAGIGGASGSGTSTPAVNIVGDIVFDLSFVAAALYLAAMHGRVRPSDFGYRRIPPAVGLAVFLAAGVSYYVLTALYQTVVGLHGTDKLPKGLGVGTSTAALVGAAIFVCVVAPVAEEFFFRGFIFGALRRWHVRIAGRDLGTWAAAAVTGILFGLVHAGSAGSQYLIPLGFFGFMLCIVRWKTGSLYPCMALHSVNNALALGYNQLHWNAGEILGLVAGSVAVIAAITLPLARRATAPAGPAPAG